LGCAGEGFGRFLSNVIALAGRLSGVSFQLLANNPTRLSLRFSFPLVFLFLQAAEKVDSRCPAPKGASDFENFRHR